MSYFKRKLSIAEEVEGVFREVQAKAWRKPKIRRNKDFLWNPSDFITPSNRHSGSKGRTEDSS